MTSVWSAPVFQNLSVRVFHWPTLSSRKMRTLEGGESHAQQKQNCSFNKDFWHVSCTCVTLSILHSHVLHTITTFLVMSATVQPKTAVMMSFVLYESTTYIHLQLTWQRSLLKEQCPLCCVVVLTNAHESYQATTQSLHCTCTPLFCLTWGAFSGLLTPAHTSVPKLGRILFNRRECYRQRRSYIEATRVHDKYHALLRQVPQNNLWACRALGCGCV